tara:strand:+ start:1654 stop:1914 length:261 start_codon:yes stop_codon:yes gene_type:complete
MKQLTETFHTIESRRRVCGIEWTIWARHPSCVCRDAELLAYQGRLVEAIEEAERAYIRERGNMFDVQFRCVTKTTTITVCTGPIEQ